MTNEIETRINQYLRSAIVALRSRGLKKSAAWAAELLGGIGEDADKTSYSTSSFGKFKLADVVGGADYNAKAKWDEKEKNWLHLTPDHDSDSPETDKLLIAKSFFDLGEYDRCAHVLCDKNVMPEGDNLQEKFLWAFSLYLAGENRKEEEICEVADPLEQSQITNGNLRLLRNELSRLYSSGTSDGYILYIYGVVLKQMQVVDLARKVLCESVAAAPCNWSAWLDLASLCSEKEHIEQHSLPKHWIFDFFRAHVALEMQQNQEAAVVLSNLSKMFPNSSYVLAQKALAQYNLRNFDEAQDLFETLMENDPHRLNNMDTYSNILYVKECKAELSHLAHKAIRSNKYRPETCCIIGNYYSLKAQHERAVLYFKRALRLNRQYLSAWTLMGHEFVELKNTEAAIEAYRFAVDINPRDYRAWYGLGQTYEILLMYFYALHYYRKAATLRPYDARMWCALAGCYEKLHRIQEAIKCYKRAECHKDREGIAAQQLARLYSEALHDREQAAHYYRKHLSRRREEDAMGGQDVVEALRFLAAYFLKDMQQLDESMRYCEMLLDYSGPEKREAEAMMREIRQLKATMARR